MSTTLRIATRFLLAKKRAMMMTLAGITFGIAFFILTQAQTSGFEQFFIRTILGTDGALRVADRFQSGSAAKKYIEGVQYPGELKDGLLKYGEVTGAAEVIKGSATLDSNFRQQEVQILGVNLEEYLKVSVLAQQIVSGSIGDFKQKQRSVLLGSELARRSNIRPGDAITLIRGDMNERYLVAGVFETGIGDIDRVRVFMHLPEARILQNKPFGCSYIQVTLADPERAPAVALRLEETLGHAVAPWQRREKVWLDVFSALRLSSAVTVMTIVLVSALGMYNTLAMLVMEKTKEIAILRSMGYTRSDITAVFLWLGAVVLTLGSLCGCVSGALLTIGVEHLPLRIRGIFSTDHFVVHWDCNHYLAAVASAAVVVMIAALFPARRAAKLEPGDIIRGTSS
jgi:lipoprotein-releasing system permease protein